jgi:signal transduction histidine kinase
MSNGKLSSHDLMNIFQLLEKNCAVHEPVFDSNRKIIDCRILKWNDFFAQKRDYTVREGQSMVEFYADPEEVLRYVNKAWSEGHVEQEFDTSLIKTNNHFREDQNFIVEVFWQRIDDHIVEISGPRIFAQQTASSKTNKIEDEQMLDSHARLINELNRISRNLHDSIIQQIYAAIIVLKGSTINTPEQGAKKDVEKVAELLGEVILDIREEVAGMSDEPIDDIDAEVRKISKIYTDSTDLAVYVTHDGEVHVPSGVAAHVRSVLREATSNAVRHGKATRIDISFEEKDEHFSIHFTDNGNGIGLAIQPGNGLDNMRSRAESLGGSMEIVNHDLGTTLNWQVPSSIMNWQA